ncbi:MAG: glycoside hydrolase family 20 zincin-like fold domain-containing protein [Promethearchaeota archaeon]
MKEFTSIIPKPVISEFSSGKFIIDNDTIILVDKQCQQLGQYLKKLLNSKIGLKKTSVRSLSPKTFKKNFIVLEIDSKLNSAVEIDNRFKLERELKSEGYNLTVKKNGVNIFAPTQNGIF